MNFMLNISENKDFEKDFNDLCASWTTYTDDPDDIDKIDANFTPETIKKYYKPTKTE